MRGGKWLLACGALAAGEGLAACLPQACEAWPFVLIGLVLWSLVGYGRAIRGWWVVSLLLLGVALFFFASIDSEKAYRISPWLRERRPHAVQAPPPTPLRREISRRIGLGLEHDPEVANLNRAILLGERRGLSRATKRIFIESGTLHVFAISGLHVMLFMGVVQMALAVLAVPYRWIGVLALPVLWGYVVLIGSPPSAVRAAAMVSFWAFAPVFWRRPNGVMAWALTFLIVYLSAPRMILELGSTLSFAVMLAIVLACRAGEGLGNGVRMALWLTFAAWVAGVPIAAYAFGRVTPGSLLANIPLIFAAQYSVVFGVLGVAASFLSETLAVHLNNLSALFTRAMVGVAEAVSRLPGANFDTGEWSLLQCAEWYAVVALSVWLVCSVRRRHLI